jgi:large exoprotein involved in heme utilization and adhesion
MKDRRTGLVILDEGRIIAHAQEGSRGNISIVVDELFRAPDSLIDASAEAGIDGTVNISSPDADIAGDLVVLEAAFVDASSLLRARCEARRDIGASSFTAAGQRALPRSPDQPLLRGYTAEDGTAVEQARGPPPSSARATTNEDLASVLVLTSSGDGAVRCS